VDSLPAALLCPLARFGAAAAAVMGTPDIRERLELARDGKLGEGDAEALGKDLDRLAALLSRR